MDLRVWAYPRPVMTGGHESALPLTDLRDAEAQRMLNILYRIIW